MTTSFFDRAQPLAYDPGATDALAFRHYDHDRIVRGKKLEDLLRFAVCYWHSFVWPGTDPFGGDTVERDWFPADTMQLAKRKADVAFDIFRLLRVPYFCFHDHDVRPEGKSLKESRDRLNAIADYTLEKIDQTGIKLLWGTANLFSNRRYMSGAATNPDPEVLAYAAGTVRDCMDVTHRRGGENYVLWGGREGYEILLNTDLAQEDAQLNRFLNLVIDYKHKIGFKGAIQTEAKLREPTQHQYDYDVATVYGFLRRHGLENEVKVNIEQGHAILAGHSFEHEIALANALGIFGSIDVNRNDYQSGWDTDQFSNNVPEVALAYYHILQTGGFATGGTNFDAKLRRQSLDADDLLAAHAGAMDVCACGFIAAHKMVEDAALSQPLADRDAGWSGHADMLAGRLSLKQIADSAEQLDPQPVSGRQEILENIVNRYV